jgi:hypothetical protein
MGQKFLEDLQDQHCDYTRTTGKRFRVMRNVGEVAPYYPINEPVLCFGSGDGFEVQAWDLLGFDAVGCEISEKKSAYHRAIGFTLTKPYHKRRGNIIYIVPIL